MKLCVRTGAGAEIFETHATINDPTSSNRNKNAIKLRNLSVSHSHSRKNILSTLSADNLRLELSDAILTHMSSLLYTKTFIWSNQNGFNFCYHHEVTESHESAIFCFYLEIPFVCFMRFLLMCNFIALVHQMLTHTRHYKFAYFHARLNAGQRNQDANPELRLLERSLCNEWQNSLGWIIKEMKTYLKIKNWTHVGQSFKYKTQLHSRSWQNTNKRTAVTDVRLQTAWIKAPWKTSEGATGNNESWMTWQSCYHCDGVQGQRY